MITAVTQPCDSLSTLPTQPALLPSSSLIFSLLFFLPSSSVLLLARPTEKESDIERLREREREIHGWGREQRRDETEREGESERERPRDREREDPVDSWVGDPEENRRTGTRVTWSFRRSDPPCSAVPVAVSDEPRDPEPKPVTRRPERKTRFFLYVFRRLFQRNQWLFRWICYENPWGKILQPMMVYFVDWLDYCEIRVLWFWGFSMDWLGDFID
jgi:hypothetical protein